MKIKFNKVWRRAKGIYKFFLMLAVGLMGLIIATLILGILGDQQALSHTPIINTVALIMALFSLPSLVGQLISLIDVNRRQTFTATTRCHNCKHLVDIKMTEDD